MELRVRDVRDYINTNSYDEFLDDQTPSSADGPVYTIRLSGARIGFQGLGQNYTLFDFNENSVLEFEKVAGGTIDDLDSSIESVVDTGRALIFQFIGGGGLRIMGLTGYEDFTSMSMDYTVLVVR